MDSSSIDELYISFLFPPSDYVSGITVFKRIVENNKKVDVLHANYSVDNMSEFNDIADNYINERIIIDMDCNVDWTECIFKFIKKGMDTIEKDYKKIYSRSWLMGNHFLASEYKFSHPGVIWHAEFSDPLIYDLSNNPKTYNEMEINDQNYIDNVNRQIADFNNANQTDFPLVENGSSAYFVAEYLCYLFADKLIFTNENQRHVMLGQFPVEIYDFAFKKSEIRMHPTLGDEFYSIKKADLNLDNGCINMAYFGKDYYGKRHFESLFYAMESLNHEYKDKIKIHLFISDDKLVKSLVNSLDSSENFIVHKPLDYLKFLNATTQFDVLIVNDVVTGGNFEINPYLPSKLSDYKGSSGDIWAFYENGSSLSQFDLKYKSDINDLDSCLNQLIQILDDYGFGDDGCSVNENYLTYRLTVLNELYERLFRRNLKLQNENRRLKKENNEIKSSNSWKITKPLRKLRK